MLHCIGSRHTQIRRPDSSRRRRHRRLSPCALRNRGEVQREAANKEGGGGVLAEWPSGPIDDVGERVECDDESSERRSAPMFVRRTLNADRRVGGTNEYKL